MKKKDTIEYIGLIKHIQVLGISLPYYISKPGDIIKVEKVREGVKLTHKEKPNKYVIIPIENISCIVYKTEEADEIK